MKRLIVGEVRLEFGRGFYLKLAICFLFSFSQSALAQFTANGCQDQIATQDRNQRTCELLMHLAQQACSSEQPIELQGNDQSRFEQAQQEKMAAHQLVQELLTQGHQSAACEARKRGSEAEKVINEIKAYNCQDLLSRCESSCSQLLQCATRLAAVTDRLGSIGSEYGRYSQPLRQDAQRAKQGVAQCQQYQRRVEEAQKQAAVHDQNKDLERICRDGTKKDLEYIEPNLGEIIEPTWTHAREKLPSRLPADQVDEGQSRKLDFDLGRSERSGSGPVEKVASSNSLSAGPSGGQRRGPASLPQSIVGSGLGSSTTHLLKVGYGDHSEKKNSLNELKSGGLRGLIQKAVHLFTGSSHEVGSQKLNSQLGGRGRPLVDGITGATGPGIFQKISTRVHQEGRLGRWVEEGAAGAPEAPWPPSESTAGGNH